MERKPPSMQLIRNIAGGDTFLLDLERHGLYEVPRFRELYRVLDLDETLAAAAMTRLARERNPDQFSHYVERHSPYEIFRGLFRHEVPPHDGRRREYENIWQWMRSKSPDLTRRMRAKYEALNPHRGKRNLQARLDTLGPEVVAAWKTELYGPAFTYVPEPAYLARSKEGDANLLRPISRRSKGVFARDIWNILKQYPAEYRLFEEPEPEKSSVEEPEADLFTSVPEGPGYTGPLTTDLPRSKKGRDPQPSLFD